ncbi:MAG TPA: DUF4157 domain-containing protein [Gemmatimonadaceae bacterium]|nr:DUF4157 domain-containing protein [Gemmatimonadaceae bacterium]
MAAPPVDKRRPGAAERAPKEKGERQAPQPARIPKARGASSAVHNSQAKSLSGSANASHGVVKQARALQRVAGNQATRRMFEDSEAPAQESPISASNESATETRSLELSITQKGHEGTAPEQEATRLGDLVARMPAASPLRFMGAALSARDRRPTPNTSVATGAPPVVREGLSSPGHPLDSSVLRTMPPELSALLADVRVHTGADAAQSADALGANAYTVGRDIVFGEGRFAPHTHAGRGLIAHEAAHVGQQGAGVMSGRVQAQSKDDKPAAKKTKPVTINLNGATTADQIMEQLAKQYYHTNQSELEKTLGPQRINRDASAKEKKAGKATVLVPAGLDADYKKLDPEEKKKIDAEVDKRFEARTQRDPASLGKSADDKVLAQQKEHMRDELLIQRELIDGLPEDIKKALFAGGADDKVTSPADYTQLLRIARKMTLMTPAQRRDYLSRINAETTSLDAMEASVESFIKFQEAREAQAERSDDAARPLLGAEGLYSLYKSWKTRKGNVDFANAVKGGSRDPDKQDSIDMLKDQAAEAETRLLEALKQKNFNSIAEFEAAIEAFRIAFRTDTVNFALDLIARFEHTLFEERKKFAAAGSGAAVASGIKATDAAKLYAEAKDEDRLSMMAQAFNDPMDKGPNRARDRNEVIKHHNLAANARANAEKEVGRGSGEDPIVTARGTDRELLSKLGPAEAQAYLQKTIEERAADVKNAREEFIADPERIFGMPDLVAAAYKVQGIDDANIYGMIVKDYIDDKGKLHLLTAGAMLALAIVLALLVPVGGWVAAAALVASAGISTYQAIEALDEYQRDSRDYNLGFISKEPSLVWVGIAIVGAALDLGMATSAILKESSAALKSLEGPMTLYAKGEVTAETLLAKIEAADGLRAEVKVAMARELKASEEASKAIGKLTGKMFAFSPFSPPDPELLKDAFRALYYSFERGVTTITKLRKDAQLMAALGDITRLSGAELHELEAAFAEVKQLAKVGKAKGMDDAALVEFVDRWSLNRGTPGFKEKLLDEMKVWKPLTKEQKQTLNALKDQKQVVSDLYSEKQEFLAERDNLIAKQKSAATRTEENRERLLEINKRLGQLDPSFNQSTIKKAVTTVDADGQPVTRFVDEKIVHPPGEIKRAEAELAKAEKLAQDAQVSLYERLRAAAPSDAAREATLKGVTVDQVGILRTPPTTLEPDHIVPVREVSDMKGFEHLTWKDQKAIVDKKENLIAMDQAANRSKGDRKWVDWPQASNFYDPKTIEKMVAKEAEVRAAIRKAIEEKLPKSAAGKP